ncbi:glycosyl transferase family 2 [Rhodobacter aestuarii]|uniref:Glycosyl transferase family 2 n=1 Tax=Rhodobacter aestuarii TaxID=453582 RepID=A0A1N7M131_9RHOB|nr:glycosyltransferase family 2 protein [Rhodobacter aestuarii]PTV94771.1 glycosyl transferase family 2 [Rhodobacter aestuarii]SIS79762.1 Glycosyl transferase family 2 [Rhodobacter aestuarii]
MKPLNWLWGRRGRSGPTICISLIKNEQDIIEPFLRHNRRFFDEMIVLDHGSTDDTAAIAQRCAQELGHIHITPIEEPAYHQSKFTTEALRAAVRDYHPDYVVFLDADEFIGSESRAAFDRVLSRVPARACGEVRWQTYLPAPMASPPPDPIAQIAFRREAELPQFSKIILRLAGHAADQIVIGQGNHSATRRGKALKTVPLPDLCLMHFPVRSREQFIAKCAVGWSTHLKRADRSAVQAFQWEKVGRLVVEEGAALDTLEVDLSQAALEYAQDFPPPVWPQNTVAARPDIFYERKYSDGKFADPARLIAEALKT